MDRVRRDETIENEAIEMDETILINCRLNHCTMIFRGGTPCFINLNWTDSVTIYRDAAESTIKLLLLQGWRPPDIPVPTGSVSTPGAGLPN